MNTWTTDFPKVLLLHAYSPNNSGDKLLVELARKTVIEAIGQAEFKIIASDACAFNSEEYVQWRSRWEITNRLFGRRIAMFITQILGPATEIHDLAKNADLIIAVGGGYLRGGTLGAAIKSWGAHFGQLRIASQYGQKAIYLPQSIGPFRGPYKKAIIKQLARVGHVFVRDDRSNTEFRAQNVSRVPDMAVLELANQQNHSVQNIASGKPILVARNLASPRGYYKFLEEVSASGEFEWAIQSTGGANNDSPLTVKMGGEDPKPLRVLLDANSPRVVVSTRLHGALSSLISGYPSIHLSYERKGWGAFEDLGIQEYVINARDVSYYDVQEKIAKILNDQSSYWSAISIKRDKLKADYDEIIDAIRSTYQRD